MSTKLKAGRKRCDWFVSPYVRNAHPEYFIFALVNGQPITPNLGWVIGLATPGDYPTFKVQIDSNESGAPVRFYVDGVQKGPGVTEPNWVALTPDGLSIWGSERAGRNESNYAKFQNMDKRTHAMSWVSWTSLNGYRHQYDHDETPTFWDGYFGPYHLFKSSSNVRVGYSSTSGGTGLTHVETEVPIFGFDE